MENEYIIDVKNLKIGFEIERKVKQIVYGVSFGIKKGQVLTILGESGSGKSVLGAAILNLLPYNAVLEGEVYFEGKEILRMSEQQFRALRGKGVAVALQGGESGLDPLLTIVDQAIEGVMFHEKLSRAEAKARVEAMFLTLGLSNPAELMKRYPYQLSGGMNQRVLLGMTSMLQPRFLLLDEPTKGLDHASKIETINALRGLRSQTESTVLLITHDLDLARVLSDLVMVMYAGQIVEILSIDDLDSPYHPYTRGLLASAPEGGFIPIPGYAPDALNMPTGCHFAPRCKSVHSQCEHKMPELFARGKGLARCFMDTSKKFEKGF